ncbi:hypothetical protein BdWA1_001600 [Babesia duncani]|uniref:THUMP domain-containing protein n=1 Tax=Babesia duncani TaxID=323732 RepID=A0AAD9PK68_9APIC|nr:hypothetical protein BdWA1_001600 [Babesia duncani]
MKSNFKILLKCTRGIENCLAAELNSFGFKNEWLLKDYGSITIANGNAETLAFLSYFSRLASGVYVNLANERVGSYHDIPRICMQLPWHHFMGPNCTFAVKCSSFEPFDSIQSPLYFSQVVKDCIKSYFGNGEFGPSVQVKNPQQQVDASLDSQGNFKVSIDGIGCSLNSRNYRHKRNIVDINGPIACALLHDVGYLSFTRHHFKIQDFISHLHSKSSICLQKPEMFTSPTTDDVSQSKCDRHDEITTTTSATFENHIVVDLFASCGVFLIEAAMHALLLAPGELVPQYAFGHFPIYTNGLLESLKLYASKNKIHHGTKQWQALRGTLFGVEQDWEKVEAILYSAANARVLELLTIAQGLRLKDVLEDYKRGINECQFLICQLPKKETVYSESGSVSSRLERYQKLLVNLGKLKKRYMPNASTILVAPDDVALEYIAEAFGQAKLCKIFTKGGTRHHAYTIAK